MKHLLNRLYTLVLLVLFSSISLKSQTVTYIDSLNKIIKETTNDSLKVHYTNQVALHYVFNNPLKADSLLNVGVRTAISKKQYYGLCQLLNTKGIYFDVIGKKDSSKKYFNEALNASKKYKFIDIEGMSYNNLGMFYWGSSDLNKALEYFYKAMSLVQKHNPQNIESIADYYNNIGLIYQELGNYSKAIENHNKSRKIRAELNLPSELAISKANLGICNFKLNDLVKAEYYFKEALNLSSMSENWRLFYSLHDNLGNLYAAQDKPKEAIEFLIKALNRPEDIKENPKSDLSILGNLVSLHNKLNQSYKALQYAEKGFSIIDKNPELWFFAANLYLSAAESNFRTGNFNQGNILLKKYKQILDSTFSEKNAKEIASLEQRFRSAEKDLKIASQQNKIQQYDLEKQKQIILFISILLILLSISGTLFYLYRRKKLLAKQVSLELEIAEQNEKNKLQEERLRISRELHDNLGSYLTLFSSTVENLNKQSEHSENILLPNLKKQIQDSIYELRKTVWLLNNSKLELDEIAIRLKDFYSTLADEKIKLKIEVNAIYDIQLNEKQSTNLFRIIQEAISNSLKYSNCDEIIITLKTVNKNMIEFSIIDNGNGFSLTNVKYGHGLKNMETRIAEINGSIEIFSEIEKGTSIVGKFNV